MNTQQQTKIIVYIGNDESFIKQLFQFATQINEAFHIDIYALQDLRKLYEWLSINHIQVDLILVEKQQKATQGYVFFELLRARFSSKIGHICLVTQQTNFREIALAKQYKLAEIFEKKDFKQQYTRFSFLLENAQLHPKASSKQPKKYQLPFWKRSFDILVAGTALLLLSPLLLLVAILIKLDSKGGFFYVSKRVGSGYKVFNFYKFRTMRAGADQELKNLDKLNQYQTAGINTKTLYKCPKCKNQACAQLYMDGEMICETVYKFREANKTSTFKKIKNDPRITKLGRFLRNTSIDELPQLINILKGDMSIVGNRPLPLYEAEKLTMDDYSQRFDAPAGLTGLWQVKKRGKGKMSEKERKQLDNIYAQNFSFWMDIQLIFKTFLVFIQKENV